MSWISLIRADVLGAVEAGSRAHGRRRQEPAGLVRADVARGHPASRGRARRSSARPRRARCRLRPSRQGLTGCDTGRCYMRPKWRSVRPGRQTSFRGRGGRKTTRPDRPLPFDCVNPNRYVQGVSKVRTDIAEDGEGAPESLVRIGELARRAGVPTVDAARVGAPLRGGRADPRRLRLPPLQRGRRAPPAADARPGRLGAGAGRGGSPGPGRGRRAQWRGPHRRGRSARRAGRVACGLRRASRESGPRPRGHDPLDRRAPRRRAAPGSPRPATGARSGRSTSPAT